MDGRREHGLSFGPAAALYDTVRPSYPADAIAWALAPLRGREARIGDIGAGTGIMTRLLQACGHQVVAVEPDPLMRRQLVASAPQAVVVAGTAEAIPLEDGCLEAAVAAQAYHWFDRDAAHAELSRVIRPGGVFAAIWNLRDETVPWVAEYSRIIAGDRSVPAAEAGRHVTDFGDPFGPVESARFHHSTTQTPESLVRLLQSRSYYLRAAPQRRASMASEVRELARTHPELAGRAEFELPYVTVVYRARRR